MEEARVESAQVRATAGRLLTYGVWLTFGELTYGAWLTFGVLTYSA